jgi:hypothetical protein
MSQPTEASPRRREKDQPTELAPLSIIRTETVLSRLPFHNLSKRGEVDIQITRQNERGEVTLRWEVSYSKKYGDARQLAYRLDTIVINRRIDELSRPLPKIICLGSLRQICKELGLRSRSGDNTNDLKKALHQNAGAYITAKLRYKTKDGTEKLLEAGFTRYSVVFTGERLPDGTKADAVYLILNEPYWEVLNNAPTRPLDYEYLLGLPPAAQRFYELVSYKIFAAVKYRHPHAKMLYSEYCTFSAQQRYYDYDHFKKQMHKVHKPHRDSQYIEKVWYESTTDQDGNLDWVMCYIPGPKALAEYKTFNRRHLIIEEAMSAVQQEEKAADDPLRAQALALVSHFYQRFHSVKNATPQPKELEQAAQLIAQYGLEKARYIVDFSNRTATETLYKPQAFGGILHYAARAIADYDEHQARIQAKTATQECPFCDRNGFLSLQDARGLSIMAHCPHNLAAIQDLEARKGLTRIS